MSTNGVTPVTGWLPKMMSLMLAHPQNTIKIISAAFSHPDVNIFLFLTVGASGVSHLIFCCQNNQTDGGRRWRERERSRCYNDLLDDSPLWPLSAIASPPFYPLFSISLNTFLAILLSSPTLCTYMDLLFPFLLSVMDVRLAYNSYLTCNSTTDLIKVTRQTGDSLSLAVKKIFSYSCSKGWILVLTLWRYCTFPCLPFLSQLSRAASLVTYWFFLVF